MNSIAFLMMLGIFGGLAYWYIRNAEAGRDGTLGPIALKGDDDPAGADEDAAYLSGAAAIRARVQEENGQKRSGDISPQTPSARAGNAAPPASPKKHKSYRLKQDRS